MVAAFRMPPIFRILKEAGKEAKRKVLQRRLLQESGRAWGSNVFPDRRKQPVGQ
ncbi:hypothetical protein [Sphingosinicella soli]|uniref:Uncharacterized protein n=1 Tax=Sphingosinicella soli TaxID=333708 RepID=A0A7W7B2B9_9SPHN|nr:hypothetical protein [Sphingosinicella soli]MBB4631757.1 hypothetical protein [Sphingosinicella soli]